MRPRRPRSGPAPEVRRGTRSWRLATAPTLATTVDGLLAAGARYLALDLTDIDFFGAQALRVLDDVERRCRHLDGRLVLVGVGPHVRRTLVLMDAHRLLAAMTPEPVRTGAGPRSGRAEETAGVHELDQQVNERAADVAAITAAGS